MKNKGISLIVLVITIIVMIILAAAIIISLNNTGIIENANKAKDVTNEKTVVEIANLAWGEAYANGTRNASDLKKAVETALKNNNLNVEDYGMVVTESGVDIAKGWLQTKDRTVIKGDQVLNIGDTINYDETNGGTYTVDKDVNWAILGAKNGKLLILSTSIIGEKEFNSEATLEGGQDVYLNGIDILNEMCSPYGKGKGAVSARSINVDDVDRVTKVDKENYEYISTGSWKYNEQVTYYWDTTDANKNKPYYEVKDNSSKKGNLIKEYTQFVYNDGKSWIKSELPSTLPSTKQKIATITDTFYMCVIGKDTDLQKSDKAYKLIFKENGSNVKYFIASSYVGMASDYVRYGFWKIDNDKMTGCSFVYSNGTGYTRKCGVRAVVELEDKVVVSPGVNTDWSLS